MLLGTRWSRTISIKNKSAMLVASSVLWHGMKCAIFENLSTTTKMESLPRFDLGKPKTKSIKMSTHGSFGTGKGVYKPCGWVLDFAFLQVMHLSHMCYTSFFHFMPIKMFMQHIQSFNNTKMPHQPTSMCFTYKQFTQNLTEHTNDSL